VQDRGRRGLRGTLAAAALLGDRAGMRPSGALCSTGYALADPGRAYVALAPEGGRVTLDLSAAAERTFVARWIAVENAALRRVGTVAGGGAASVFDLPAMPTALVLTPPPA
jgi:hypothetical protein